MSLERISLKRVSKHFGNMKVIRDLSLGVDKGEVLALLGDNGAGKSTLIKMIAGYHKPTSGEIHWEGEPIDLASYSPEHARKIGIQTVYQHLGLVDELSIARNFFLGIEPKKSYGPFRTLDQKRMRDVVRHELDNMGIKRKLDPDDSVSTLSGGERQAIAICRARYFGAKLLILDEPTSALSLRQTEQVLTYIKEAAQSGISVIFITHTLHHIESIVDKIAILHHGKSVGHFMAGAITTEECADLIVHGEVSA